TAGVERFILFLLVVSEAGGNVAVDLGVWHRVSVDRSEVHRFERRFEDAYQASYHPPDRVVLDQVAEHEVVGLVHEVLLALRHPAVCQHCRASADVELGRKRFSKQRLAAERAASQGYGYGDVGGVEITGGVSDLQEVRVALAEAEYAHYLGNRTHRVVVGVDHRVGERRRRAHLQRAGGWHGSGRGHLLAGAVVGPAPEAVGWLALGADVLGGERCWLLVETHQALFGAI